MRKVEFWHAQLNFSFFRTNQEALSFFHKKSKVMFKKLFNDEPSNNWIKSHKNVWIWVSLKRINKLYKKSKVIFKRLLKCWSKQNLNKITLKHFKEYSIIFLFSVCTYFIWQRTEIRREREWFNCEKCEVSENIRAFLPI